MKQISLGQSGFERRSKRTCKREFLEEMNRVVRWGELVALIAPYAPALGTKGGRPSFAPANGPGAMKRGAIAHGPSQFVLQLPLSETVRLNAFCGGVVQTFPNVPALFGQRSMTLRAHIQSLRLPWEKVYEIEARIWQLGMQLNAAPIQMRDTLNIVHSK